MLNLQGILDTRLWVAIESNYQSGDFTGVIVDSIHFLGELIRDRSGLEGDGVALIGEAFGGNNPKLKVNSLQTESHRNVQKGVEQLLRGIYQGIRNPRSHEKYHDSSEDADAIVLFINYLIRIIDHSKSPFDLDSYLERVFDPSFSESERYADLLVAEIPERKRWDTLLAVFRQKEARGKHWTKLRYFFQSILKTLSSDEITSFCEVVSEELKTTHSDGSIVRILQTLPIDYWPRYEEIARIRTESKLIASINDGKYDRAQHRSTAGTMGTWATGLAGSFFLKDQLLSALCRKLGSSDEEEQDYVLALFASSFPELVETPSAHLRGVLRTGLAEGDVRFHRALWFLSEDFGKQFPGWRKALGQTYDSFVERTSEALIDGGITDDEVPF